MTVAITGLGLACGAGYGRDAFETALFEAPNLVGVLLRKGRVAPDGSAPFIGVEMPDPPDVLPRRLARHATLPARVAMAVLDEAWNDANLDAVAPERIGVIVGGSNLAEREQDLEKATYAKRLDYVPPSHAYVFLDTDVCGLACAHRPIRGFAQTVGAASASGSAAIIAGVHAIRTGRADACIVIGIFNDPGSHDLQALRASGAMGSARYARTPERACRPMDKDRDGFIYGESCAALVLQADTADRCHGVIRGVGQTVDGTRGPQPGTDGQVAAVLRAIADAGIAVRDIDHVSAHATGTPAGDDTELTSLRRLDLQHARINATKSILGHPLAAAGAVELAAVLVQMGRSRLHANRNLVTPLDDQFAWVGQSSEPHMFRHSLKLSFGFGGIATALIVGPGR
ncbi:MAG: beta-ketoacyl synthase N-terminal-like domain-containing protein [Roseovarius sp.]